ncbi:hypothetical protein V6N13_089037 [Hibiscus sabdariffa]
MHKEYNEGPRCYLEEFSNSDWVVSMCTQLQNARVSSVPNNNELVKPHGKAHANELCKAIALRKGVTIENTSKNQRKEEMTWKRTTRMRKVKIKRNYGRSQFRQRGVC